MLQKLILIPVSVILLILVSLWIKAPKLHAPIIGDVELGSEAQLAGFRGDDQILKFKNESIESWEEFFLLWEKHIGETVDISVKRAHGENSQIKLTVPNKIFVSTKYLLPIATLKSSSPLLIYGVKVGDQFKSIEGTPIKKWREIGPALAVQNSERPLNLEYVPLSGKVQSIGVAPFGAPYSLESLGVENPSIFVFGVKPNSLGAKLGLEENDRLLMVQGQAVNEKFDLTLLERALSVEKKMNVIVIRGDESKELSIPTPQLKYEMSGLKGLHQLLGIDNSKVYKTSDELAHRDFVIAIKFMLRLGSEL